MPRCIVCKAALPPDFLQRTSDGLADKCVFCERGNDFITYFSKSENRQMIINKKEIINEYQELLNEISNTSNIKDILDILESRKKDAIVL